MALGWAIKEIGIEIELTNEHDRELLLFALVAILS